MRACPRCIMDGQYMNTYCKPPRSRTAPEGLDDMFLSERSTRGQDELQGEDGRNPKNRDDLRQLRCVHSATRHTRTTVVSHFTAHLSDGKLPFGVVASWP